MVELSNEYLKAAFTGKIKPSETMVNFYYKLKMHADGEYPRSLIEERRPSESLSVKDYREKIFAPITEPAFNKIITSLQKIRKSPDYNITYNSKDLPRTIKESESPENYFEKNYPVHKSLTNWTFSVLLKEYLIDSNAVVLVMPNNFGADDSTYLKPVATIFNSDRVIEFVENESAILLSTETVTYKSADRSYSDGQVIYVVNDMLIQRWIQTGLKKEMSLDYEFVHEIGYMPAFKVKGNYNSVENNSVIYKPKIFSIVHRLNEAVREYSDLQAEVVQHIHSEKWIYATQICGTCNGNGKVKVGDKLENCTNSKCSNGRVTNNPYETLVVTPQNSLEGTSPIPTPPAGYIQKDVQIVTIQDKRVQDHIYYALSAINMEFLAETPLNQSGTAKEVDRDELNVFVNSIGEDIINIMDEIVITSMRYRYGKLVNDESLLMAICPLIQVPERFDLLNTSYLLTEIKSAKDSGLNAFVVNALQIDYANKKFSHDKEIAGKLQSIIELDPLSGFSNDEKLSMLQNDGVTKLDYVISCNIETFIDTAIDENERFLSLPTKQKKIVIEKIGVAKIESMSLATDIMTQINISQTL